MKIGIIGGGFAGLSAAYFLSKEGYDVTIIESSDHLGGLAAGFQDRKWDWSLEEHYHHWFTTDNAILELAKEIDFPVSTYRPITSILSEGNIYQFDSPASLMQFPHLGVVDKLRTGTLMTLLKLLPFAKYLEGVTARKFLIKYGGKNAWRKLWGPLFRGKFGDYSGKIPAVWFWARIKKRTQSLVYPDGGYKKFIDEIRRVIHKRNVNIVVNEKVQRIKKEGHGIRVHTVDKDYGFDKVICTLPTPIFLGVTKELPETYRRKLKPMKGLGAVTLLLSLKNKFFTDDTYWLNINETGYPFLAVVEHTNFVDAKHYGGEHILYVGNYLQTDHRYFEYSSKKLLEEFLSALTIINPEFKKSSVNKTRVFKSKFAQPIIPLNYSSKIPKMETPIDGLYLVNMQQVYPWDRGTNYAVELGRKVTEIINQ